MRTLRAIGWWRLLLLGLFVACAVLHLKQVAQRPARVGRGLRRVAIGRRRRSRPCAASGRAPRRRRPAALAARAIGFSGVGDADLRGVGPFGFVARTYAAAARARDLRVPLAYERRGAPGAHDHRARSGRLPVAHAAAHLHARVHRHAGAGAPARAHASRASSSCSPSPTACTGRSSSVARSGRPYAWEVIFLCASARGAAAHPVRGAGVSRRRSRPAGGRLPWWPWLFAIFGPISSSWVFGVPMPPEAGFRGAFAVNVVFIVTLLVVLTRNFRAPARSAGVSSSGSCSACTSGTVPVLLADVAGCRRAVAAGGCTSWR